MAILAFVPLVLALHSAAPTPAFSGGFPVTRRDQIYPLSAIKRGDRGIGYTVFSGPEVKPFQVEILGVMESMIGPGQDVIMAKLTGPEIEFTGVIAGMSGSPVYIDGKLVGAVAYRFGSFSKEAIAGITPIQNMLASEGGAVDKALPAVAAMPRGHGLDLTKLRTRDLLPALAPVTPVSAGPNGARPLETPLSISGLDSETLAQLAASIQPFGMMAVAGGAHSSAVKGVAGKPRKAEPNTMGEAGRVAAPPIAPASPIAALLMRGDVNVAAIGTVTMVEGDKVWAFGHPFLGNGHVAVPMSTAAIINTLASEAGSYKQGIAAREVGVISHDRLTAISGALGKAAPMVPVSVRLRRPGSKSAEPLLATEVEIIDSPDWMPVMLEAIVATTASRRIGYEPGGTLDMTARIVVGDRAIEIVDSYTAPPPFRVSAFASRDIATIAAIIASNEIEPAKITRIEIDLASTAEIHMAMLESVTPDAYTAKAGETLGFSVVLEPYRGTARTERIEVHIPKDATDHVDVYVGGGIELDRRDSEVYGERFPTSLDELLAILGDRRPARAIHARTYLPRNGLRIDASLFTSLPASQRAAFESNTRRTTRTISEAFGPSTSRPIDEVLVGGASVTIRIVH